MTWDGVERRKRRRYGVRDAAVRYKPASLLSFLRTPSVRHLLLNLSEGGLEFISREPFEEGLRLALQVTAPPVAGTVYATGRVARVKKSKSQDAFRVGVQFVRISPRSAAFLKAIVNSAVADGLDLSTQAYLKELERF